MRLRDGRDQGFTITFYCAQHLTPKACSGWIVGWDQLIQYFGLDAVVTEVRPALLTMVECPWCGGPAETISIQPPVIGPDLPMRSWAWQNEKPQPLTSAERRDRQMLEEHRKMMSAYADVYKERDQAISDAWAARARAEKAINDARDKGIFLIGPPNPHQFKKGRPSMKG